MKIAVYQTADDVPEALRCVAQFVVGGKFTPVYVAARTKDEAREKAQEFWTKYSDDIQRGRVPKVKKGEAGEPIRTAESEFQTNPRPDAVRTAESVFDPLDDI